MNQNLVEQFFVLMACIWLAWIGLGDIWGHSIHHPFPYSYLATDTFQHQTRAQWIKDEGNYRYEAPYYTAGLKDVVGFYPPLLHHLTIILSHISGQEVYDVMILLPVLFAITGVLLLYILIRKIDWTFAILCLPFTLFLFFIKESLVAFLWGHWPAFTGVFFLFFSCAAITQWHKKGMWIVIVLLLTGTVHAHTASFFFAAFFTMMWLFYTYFINTALRPLLRDIFLALFFVGLLNVYFLHLFNNSFVITNKSTLFKLVLDWTGGGGYVQLIHFGPVRFLLYLSIFMLFFLSGHSARLFMFLFFLLAGLSNYVGFSLRAFNVRFFWPITLTPFFALPLYIFLKKLMRKPAPVALLLALLLFVSLTHAYYEKSVDQKGLMNEYIWETLQWLKLHTPQNATVYFGYGDLYDQDAGLGNAQRVFARTETEFFIPYFQNKTISRFLPLKKFVEAGGGLPRRVSLFSYASYLVENPDLANNQKMGDFCAFDYYVFDRVSQYKELLEFSLRYPNLMMKHPHIRVVFQNEWSIVLLNEKPGVECLVL